MKKNATCHDDFPTVSVIIPVYNNTDQLFKCLTALYRQSYPSYLYEIIVVDNGSTEDVTDVLTAFSKATYLREARPGSYIARNTGIKNAKSEILAFTDSDCIPKSNWLEEGVLALSSDDNNGLVAGEVEMSIEHSGKATMVETYQLISGFNQQTLVKERHFGVTANIFTKRNVLNSVGDFNADLKSGGDLEWGRRVYNKGYLLQYSEKAIVSHPVRTSLISLIKQARRVTGGRYNMLKINDGGLNLGEVSKPIGSIFNSIKVFWQHDLADTYFTKMGLLMIGFILRSVMFYELMMLKAGLNVAKR